MHRSATYGTPIVGNDIVRPALKPLLARPVSAEPLATAITPVAMPPLPLAQPKITNQSKPARHIGKLPWLVLAFVYSLLLSWIVFSSFIY